MQTIEYKTIDKSDWPRGCWDDEPDKRQWRDHATGYPCLIVRAGRLLGHLCGYAGVPSGHPCHGKGCGEVVVDVHGGLTVASHGDKATTPELWQSYRAQAEKVREIANAYPHGDEAKFTRERANEIKSYDAFKNWRAAAGVSHVADDGEDGIVWWFGFDCAHFGDVTPGPAPHIHSFYGGGTYKVFDFVKRETERLAKQLAALS